MTREEAIKILKAIRVYECYPKSASEETKEAIDMAIVALADRPTESDFISKAEVLEIYSELYWFDSDCEVVSKAEVDKIYERLQSLPSADRPKNMIHIDDVYRLIAGHSDYHGDSILSAFTCLVEGKDVKPIAPLDESADRPTGEWKQISPARIYECSECGQNVMTNDIEAYKFCHGCGAKMGGEEE